MRGKTPSFSNFLLLVSTTLLWSLQLVYGETLISNCGTFYTPNEVYVLNANIPFNGDEYCLKFFDADNIVLDGRNFTLACTNTDQDYCMYSILIQNQDKAVVKNVKILGGRISITVADVTFANNEVTSVSSTSLSPALDINAKNANVTSNTFHSSRGGAINIVIRDNTGTANVSGNSVLGYARNAGIKIEANNVVVSKNYVADGESASALQVTSTDAGNFTCEGNVFENINAPASVLALSAHGASVLRNNKVRNAQVANGRVISAVLSGSSEAVTVDGNTVENVAAQYGIYVEAPGSPCMMVNNIVKGLHAPNSVCDQYVLATAAYGIYISAGSALATIENNSISDIVSGSGEDCSFDAFLPGLVYGLYVHADNVVAKSTSVNDVKTGSAGASTGSSSMKVTVVGAFFQGATSVSLLDIHVTNITAASASCNGCSRANGWGVYGLFLDYPSGKLSVKNTVVAGLHGGNAGSGAEYSARGGSVVGVFTTSSNIVLSNATVTKLVSGDGATLTEGASETCMAGAATPFFFNGHINMHLTLRNNQFTEIAHGAGCIDYVSSDGSLDMVYPEDIVEGCHGVSEMNFCYQPDDSRMCCQACMMYDAPVMCRDPMSVCDVAEYCAIDSGDCPADSGDTCKPTSAAQSYAYGPIFAQTPLKAGVETSFFIQPIDQAGNPQRFAQSQLSDWFTVNGGGFSAITARLLAEGMWVVNLTVPERTANNQLTVTLNGDHIKGSPFTIATEVPLRECENGARFPNNKKCNCLSGYIGTFCDIASECAAIDPMQLREAHFPVLDPAEGAQYMTHNILYLSVLGPVVHNRTYTNVTFVGAYDDKCKLGYDNSFWSHTLVGTPFCADHISLAMPWGYHEGCGFIPDPAYGSMDEDNLHFKGRVKIIYTDYVGQILGQTMRRKSSVYYDIFISFPTKITVNIEELTINATTGLKFALTGFNYDSNLAKLVLEFSSVVNWPYMLKDGMSVTLPEGVFQFADIVKSNVKCSPSEVGTSCVQKLTISEQVVSGVCTFDGNYTIDGTLVSCRDSDKSGCDTKPVGVTFAIKGSNICGSVSVNPSVGGKLVAVDDSLENEVTGFSMGYGGNFLARLNTTNTILLNYRDVILYEVGRGAVEIPLIQSFEFTPVAQRLGMWLYKEQNGFGFTFVPEYFMFTVRETRTYMIRASAELVFEGNPGNEKREIRDFEFTFNPKGNNKRDIDLVTEVDEVEEEWSSNKVQSKVATMTASAKFGLTGDAYDKSQGSTTVSRGTIIAVVIPLGILVVLVAIVAIVVVTVVRKRRQNNAHTRL